METETKKESWINNVFTPRNIFIFIIICIVLFLVYNLPVFWTRPKTAEYLPKEWTGAYLGVSAAELKKIESNLSHYKMKTFFLPKNCYYENKIGGEFFDSAHYTANFYGMITDIDFSRHFKEQQLDKRKYEYLKHFISKYGGDYQKALWVYTPYKDTRYTYELFIWEKKDARMVLEFSFYENNKKNGYIAKDRGVFLHIKYPGTTGENFFNRIIKDQKNIELQERFRLHFSDLEKITEESKGNKQPQTAQKDPGGKK